MSNVTVKELAEMVGTPVERLLGQLTDAGIKVDSQNETISDEEKGELLDFLRKSHGKKETISSGSSRKKTLHRTRETEQRQPNAFAGNDEIPIKLGRRCQTAFEEILRDGFNINCSYEDETYDYLNEIFGGRREITARGLNGNKIELTVSKMGVMYAIKAFINNNNLVADDVAIKKIQNKYEKRYSVEISFSKSGGNLTNSHFISQLKSDLERVDHRNRVNDSIKIWRAFLQAEKSQIESLKLDVAYTSFSFLENENKLRLILRNSGKGSDAQLQRLRELKKIGEAFSISIDDEESASHDKITGLEIIQCSKESVDLTHKAGEAIRQGNLTIPDKGVLSYFPAGDYYQVSAQYKAIDRLLNADQQMPLLQDILFSENDQLELPSTFPRIERELEFLNPDKVNAKQKSAVKAALDTPDALFMQGPPGTGKTTFIVELAYQIAKSGGRILICSQTNMAVDNALSRLSATPEIMAIRLGNEDRVDQIGQGFCGDNAIRRWLDSLLNKAHQRKSELQTLEKKREVFSEQWHEIEGWQSLIEGKEPLFKSISKKTDSHQQAIVAAEENVREREVQETIVKGLMSFNFSNELSDEVRVTEWHEANNGLFLADWKKYYFPRPMAIDRPWGAEKRLNAYKDRYFLSDKIQNWQKFQQALVNYLLSMKKKFEPIESLYIESDGELLVLQNKYVALQGMLSNLEHKALGAGLSRDVDLYKPIGSLIVSCLLDFSPTAKNLHLVIESIDAYTNMPLPSDVGNEANSRDKSIVSKAFHSILDGEFKTADLMSVLQERKRHHIKCQDDKGYFNNFFACFSDDAKRIQKTAEHAQEYYISLLMHCSKLRNEMFGTQGSLHDPRILGSYNSSTLTQLILTEINDQKKKLNQQIEENRESYGDAKLVIEEAEESMSNLTNKINASYNHFKSSISKKLEPLLDIKTSAVDRPLSFDEIHSRMSDEITNIDQKIGEISDQLNGDIESRLEQALLSQHQLMQEFQTKMQEACHSAEKEIIHTQREIAELHEQQQAYQQQLDRCRDNSLELFEQSGIGERYASEPFNFQQLERARQDWLNQCGSPEELAQKSHILDKWIGDLETSVEEPSITPALRAAFDNQVNVVGCTCVYASKKTFLDRFDSFDYVVIDEISKATATEILIPSLLGKKIIFVGDYMQLAPILGREESYAGVIESLNQQPGGSNIDKTHLEDELNRKFFRERYLYFKKHSPNRTAGLTFQYRMHSQIMEAVNQFYTDDDQLEIESDRQDYDKRHGLTVGDWLKPRNNVVWIDLPYDGKHAFHQRGSSRYNQHEVKLIQHIISEMTEVATSQLDVGITSVYGAQVAKIDRALKGDSLDNIDLAVSTVDKFQGREKKIMIVSLVLNQDQNDPRREVVPSAFLQTPERINVAFSRAQNLLIIIGCSKVYCNGSFPAAKNYRKVLEIAKSTGGYMEVNSNGVV